MSMRATTITEKGAVSMHDGDHYRRGVSFDPLVQFVDLLELVEFTLNNRTFCAVCCAVDAGTSESLDNDRKDLF